MEEYFSFTSLCTLESKHLQSMKKETNIINVDDISSSALVFRDAATLLVVGYMQRAIEYGPQQWLTCIVGNIKPKMKIDRIRNFNFQKEPNQANLKVIISLALSALLCSLDIVCLPHPLLYC